MIFDLHNHTRASFDGFTTVTELIKACEGRGIDVVAITEHDLVTDVLSCETEGERPIIIPGCEFTDSNGAHIIGLFVSEALPVGSPATEILSHIESQSGFSIMPHPYKPGSGFLATTADESLIHRFDAIEIVNGGWRAEKSIEDLKTIAKRFNLLPLASSDSHKFNQVGMCCTRLKTNNDSQDFKALLMNASADDVEILIERKLLNKGQLKTVVVQRSRVYQMLLRVIPKVFRRAIKLSAYKLADNKKVHSPDFEVFSVESVKW
jgi:predicted metal-dependent phosphoesterase TrpH